MQLQMALSLLSSTGSFEGSNVRLRYRATFDGLAAALMQSPLLSRTGGLVRIGMGPTQAAGG
jgi:hypothetical protein